MFAEMIDHLFSAFIQSLRKKGLQWEDEAGFIKVHEKSEEITSIRLNPFKSHNLFKDNESIKWTKYGRYLATRPFFTGDPLFHAGCYYVQEASSMFLEHVLRSTVDLDKNLRILDLCAAPGGKSTLISSLLNEQSLLVSNELIKSRVRVLTDNMTRWGILNSVVSNNDPKIFSKLKGYFDVIVVDAPCSGSGMFRKNPEAIYQWSENSVQLCSERQQRILADCYDALKQDGVLIYSTCSYSVEENEDIADWLCENFELKPIRIPIDSTWGIIETYSPKYECFGYRFYPHRIKGEGFFITCFKKHDYPDSTKSFLPPKMEKVSKLVKNSINSWLKPDIDYDFWETKEGYHILNKNHVDDLKYLNAMLYLKKAGVFAGRMMGQKFLPEHELAQSIILSNNVERINLSEEDALRYLRKDNLYLNLSKRDWVLMCYEGFGLGWAKFLPKRINNYYPKEMRILKEF